MPTREYNQEEYYRDFTEGKKRTIALEHALDIRKFEIELYWKRAAYFWTFIGATFGGFVAIQALDLDQQQDLSVILSCVGIVFSFAWLCVNRGSKHWQENWEKHVDMLEDGVTGPLYKVVLSRSAPRSFQERISHAITGTSPFSVSKINQIISLYITALWACLLFYSLPKVNCITDIKGIHLAVILISFISCLMFYFLARSYTGGYWHRASIRTTEIKNNP